MYAIFVARVYLALNFRPTPISPKFKFTPGKVPPQGRCSITDSSRNHTSDKWPKKYSSKRVCWVVHVLVCLSAALRRHSPIGFLVATQWERLDYVYCLKLRLLSDKSLGSQSSWFRESRMELWKPWLWIVWGSTTQTTGEADDMIDMECVQQQKLIDTKKAQDDELGSRNMALDTEVDES